MKKIIFILLLLFTNFFISCHDDENTMHDLVKNNEFSFFLVNPNGTYGGWVTNNHDLWNCDFGTDYLYFGFDSREIFKDKVTVQFLVCNFIVCGNPSYRSYGYPEKGSFSITKKQIEQNLAYTKNGEKKNIPKIVKDGIYTIPECNFLVIAENVRLRSEPLTSSNSEIIGKLKKFQKVVSIGTGVTEKIDNLEAPWYKIRLEDGTEGWVFGGFVQIYFSEEDLQLLYKAFEKEGSEYNNRFITPGNS
jgi:hypothetical protein